MFIIILILNPIVEKIKKFKNKVIAKNNNKLNSKSDGNKVKKSIPIT